MGSDTKIVTFQAPRQLAERLRELAAQHDRSLSAEVRRAVRTTSLLTERTAMANTGCGENQTSDQLSEGSAAPGLLGRPRRRPLARG
jgi:plasmid stability protein